nr:PREDICTED: microtubule-associated proteins 1A/1B light chain 3C-like [Opisthocomus hoazin]
MHPSESSSRPFKQRKSLATRMHEVTEIRIKYPNKIPVVVERYQKEKTLPPLTRTKFLVSQDLPLSQFAVTLRTRLCLASSQTFYLLVNNKGLPNMAVTMQELYRDNKDEDGFLYLTYASQEMFGSSSSTEPLDHKPPCHRGVLAAARLGTLVKNIVSGATEDI